MQIVSVFLPPCFHAAPDIQKINPKWFNSLLNKASSGQFLSREMKYVFKQPLSFFSALVIMEVANIWLQSNYSPASEQGWDSFASALPMLFPTWSHHWVFTGYGHGPAPSLTHHSIRALDLIPSFTQGFAFTFILCLDCQFPLLYWIMFILKRMLFILYLSSSTISITKTLSKHCVEQQSPLTHLPFSPHSFHHARSPFSTSKKWSFVR